MANSIKLIEMQHKTYVVKTYETEKRVAMLIIAKIHIHTYRINYNEEKKTQIIDSKFALKPKHVANRLHRSQTKRNEKSTLLLLPFVVQFAFKIKHTAHMN